MTGLFEGLPSALRDGLSPRQLAQLEALLGVLEADARAPTSIRDSKRALGVHLADSLTALEVDSLRCATSIVDLGSGSGFPGLALAVALPQARVVLVESQRRKCEFLERASARAEVANAHVVCARVEEWQPGAGRQQAVVARALAPQPVVLEYAAPLLRMGGLLVDWRGRRNRQEEEQASCAAEQLGLRLAEVRRTVPYAGARDHHLHVFEKLSATPLRFPRRVGVARKRPLGC
jgi:16S rRNA (guanine527-N7)-methyltransferase